MSRYFLQYNKPAQDSNHGWQREVLPIGNGAMGMCIFGGVAMDRLQFNEKTLWQGGPSASRPDYNGGNIVGSHQHLAAMQKALEQGDDTKVLNLKDKLVGLEEGYGNYLNFGDILVEFPSLATANVEDYRRSLDIENAVASVDFKADGKAFSRRYFASHPQQVVAIKYILHKTDCVIAFNLAQDNKVFAEGNSLVATGNIKDNNLMFLAKITVVTDGVVSAKNGKLMINSADFCEVYMSCGTEYAATYPHYRGADPTNRIDNNITRAMALGYDKLLTEHASDYKSLFDRVRINLVGDNMVIPTVATDALLKKYTAKVGDTSSRYLEELLFNYGRYLIIASSRGGSLPANLQGVWNNSNAPAWGCDYHLNVNFQMCYWHVFTTNLAELALPMLDYMETLRIAGRVTAKEYHGIESTAENKENGWIAHTQCTPFGWTCPGWDFYWGWSPAASTWMMQNCYDHYEFTTDKAILKEKIYPMMRENAKFWLQNLVYHKAQDRWVSSPSFSPEHGPISVGNTYEQEMVYILFRDTIAAAKDLGIDADFVAQLSAVLPKLAPLGVGTFGQIKEWYEEDEWAKSKFFKKSAYKSHRCQSKHRHASHLIGLYPAVHICRETPELLAAAKKSLIERGLGGKFVNNSGWGKANKINMWARAKEGEEAYKLVNSLISNNIATNLWDLHPPFQMDGNCGYTAGVAEMLVYSCNDYIELLPALPKAWDSGSISGICARGNYTVNLEWKNGNVVAYQINSTTKKLANVMICGKIMQVKVGMTIKCS